MDVKPPTITVIVALPLTVSDAAVITLCPGPTPVTNPDWLIVATLGVPLLQNVFDESFFCDPSLKVPSAVI